MCNALQVIGQLSVTLCMNNLVLCIIFPLYETDCLSGWKFCRPHLQLM